MAFSTTGTTGAQGLSSEISVTPLIDVLLVLLIIFMVIVPVAPRGLGAVLPSTIGGAAGGQDVHQPVVIEVEQAAADIVRYRVDGVILDRSQIVPRLVDLLARRSVRQVLLKADARLDFGVVSAVIDAGQAAGADSVGLLTPRDTAGPR